MKKDETVLKAVYILLIFKSRTLTFKKICVNCLIEGSLTMMKNASYFILKACFVLKIFGCLSQLFGRVGKTACLERKG